MVADVLQAMAALVLRQPTPIGQPWSRVLLISSCRSPPALELAPLKRAVRVPTVLEDLPATALWPVNKSLPTRNALVRLPCFIAGGLSTVPRTTCFFNSFAPDHDSILTSSEPAEWLKFLRQTWEDDNESFTCLQEWFGYLLTPDTWQQKIKYRGRPHAISPPPHAVEP